MYTRQSWKVEGSMDMTNTLFLTTVAVESNLLLLLFFIALANIRPGLSRAIHSNIRTERWTQNHLQYLSGLSSALPFPTASRNDCRLVYGLLRDRSLFISWSEKGVALDFRGDHLIFRRTNGGISRNWELKSQKGGSLKTLERFRGGTIQICLKNEDMVGREIKKVIKSY